MILAIVAVLALSIAVLVLVDLRREKTLHLERLAHDFGLRRLEGESNRDLRRRVVDRATMRYGRRL